MNNIIKKATLYYILPFLISSYHLYAAKLSIDQPSKQAELVAYKRVPSKKRSLLVESYCSSIPFDIAFLIRCFIYDNPSQYRNRVLPHDLSEKDLSGFDFTGCHFTDTNLTATKLDDVILEKTSCDYKNAFSDNLKKNKCAGGTSYHNGFYKVLESIKEVYENLKSYSQQAELLKIASAFSQLPFYKGVQWKIMFQYWSCKLLELKERLKDQGNKYADTIVVLAAWSLNFDKNCYCWQTNYPQDKIDLYKEATNLTFEDYLSNFKKGFDNYNCRPPKAIPKGVIWYKKKIIENIQGLKRASDAMKKKGYNLPQEVYNIANALSKSYETQGLQLLLHYLFCQKRLVILQKQLPNDVKQLIYYSPKKRDSSTFSKFQSWS